jgi:putative redox protein
MKANVVWKEHMAFDGDIDGHHVLMDAKAPLGKNSGASPKELLALGIGGCTAMDVIALLNKYKQLPESFSIEVDITPTQGKQPATFETATIIYKVKGTAVTPEKLIEAVTLSQTKYCGVSAMLANSFPIQYRVELNDVEINSGKANFK